MKNISDTFLRLSNCYALNILNRDPDAPKHLRNRQRIDCDSPPPKKIAKVINILIFLHDTIIPFHIKNSGCVVENLMEMNMADKFITSLDIKFLFTKEPV